MSRIVDLASANQLMSHVFKTQKRLNDLQTQLSSGQASQSYAGIGPGSDRLIRLENSRDLYQRFVDNNKAMDLRLKSTETTLASVQKTIEDFRQSLLDFSTGATDDTTRVKDVQDAAFKQLKSLEGLLNTEFDGRFLFSGSRVTTRPVDLGLSTLEGFQKTFDGNAVTVPTTRDLHLAQISLTSADTGALAFDRETGMVTAANADSLKAVPVGSTIHIGGTSNNNGVFTVTDIDPTGKVMTVRSEQLAADEVGPAVITPPPGVTMDWPTGDLTFDAAAGTIKASNPGSLAPLPEGSTFTISGSITVPSNDGTYTVGTNDGDTITIASHTLADEDPAPPTATIDVASYYQGDDLDPVHRLDSERSFAQDLNATHPAFEKAIRAMKLIAQGAFGSEGGLDQNPERIDQALYLLNSAAERLVEGAPPFGPEVPGNIENVQMELGLQRVMITDTNERLGKFIGSFDAQVAETEVIDRTQVATQLFDQANALEASLTTIARVRQLSLVKFL